MQDALHVDEKSDDRTIPAEKLEFRQEVKFPVGTTLRWDEELINSFVMNRTLVSRESNNKVLDLKLNGRTHEFNYWELKIEINKLVDSEITAMQQDHVMCRGKLAALLFAARFPYEDP